MAVSSGLRSARGFRTYSSSRMRDHEEATTWASVRLHASSRRVDTGLYRRKRPGGPMSEPDTAPYPPGIQLQHRKLLEESAISAEVAAERGYRTVTTRSELSRLGFGRNQCQ